MDTFEHDEKNLELNSLLNRQPMKLREDWCNGGKFLGERHQPCCTILHPLEWLNGGRHKRELKYSRRDVTNAST